MAETNVSGSLGNAYPKPAPEAPPVVDHSAELKTQIEELQSKAKELETENSSLKEKLADVEKAKLAELAGSVADLKISRGLLEKDKRDDAVAELSKHSIDTLTILDKELSAIKVKLSDTPAPLAPPASNPPSDPPAKTDAEVMEEKLKAERKKLFGHEEPATEYYVKLAQQELERSRF